MVARHAGKKHAASDASVMTRNANPNDNGSRGLTSYSRYPSNRVDASATAVPPTIPAAVSARPRDITSRNKWDGVAPRAIRNPNSRVLCETAYDITPYNPIAASSRANPPSTPTKVTATSCGDVAP